jgi:hypothetical protein
METARNILGEDMEELPKDAGNNALKEMANIACGFFLAEKFGPDKVFDLSIPKSAKVSKRKLNSLLQDERYFLLSVDDSPFLVKLELKK